MQLTFWQQEAVKSNDSDTVVNVASVPQRSLFRYPGGKTWFIPTLRKWLGYYPASLLVEPFAGGGVVGLTAVCENLTRKVELVELDEEVAAVWEVLINGDIEILCKKILQFHMNVENVELELERPEKSIYDIAFSTILKNRVFHGGILAKGSGMIKNGENGKGLSSRWYPSTLVKRIQAIAFVRNKISFINGDGFERIEHYKENKDVFFFVDPPYYHAGKRLYNHYDIDHERLFNIIASVKGRFVMTYDNNLEILKLADKYGLKYTRILMKTTHHLSKEEIVLSDSLDWL